MAVHILSTRDTTQDKWMRGACSCGTTFRFQRSDLSYDRREMGWINCPSKCGRVIMTFTSE